MVRFGKRSGVARRLRRKRREQGYSSPLSRDAISKTYRISGPQTSLYLRRDAAHRPIKARLIRRGRVPELKLARAIRAFHVQALPEWRVQAVAVLQGVSEI